MTEMIVLKNTQRVQQTFNLTHRAGAKRQLFERVGDKHGSKVQKRLAVPGSITVLGGAKSEPVPAFYQHLPEIENAIKAKRVSVEPAPAAAVVAAPAPAVTEEAVHVSVDEPTPPEAVEGPPPMPRRDRRDRG